MNAFSKYFTEVPVKVSKLEELTGQHQDLAHRNIDTLQKTASAILDKGMRDDQPTGETPQKRQWNYVEQWPLAPSRDQIVQGLKPIADEVVVEEATPVAKTHPPVIEPVETTRPEFPLKAPRESRASMATEALVESRKRNISTRTRKQL